VIRRETIWRVTVEGERGFLRSENSLPGLNCERCSIWSGFRLVPIPIEKALKIAKLLSHSLEPILLPDFKFLLQRIIEQGILCPISATGPLEGFLPGDSFGPFAWVEKPSVESDLEPFFSIGNLAFIARGERLINRLFELKIRLRGVWITSIREMDNTWGFLIDDRRESLVDDGLYRETCPLCGRLDNVKSLDQKRRLGLLRSSMLKSRTLARDLVPDRDIFVTDYMHSWFIKQSIYDLFGDELSSNKSVTLEEWSVVDSKN
jgi:hypothetical protein